MVYTEWATGDLAVRNMATGEVRSFYGVDWGRGPAWFEGPVFSPDDRKVAYVRFPSRTGDSTRIDVDSIEGGHRETVYDFNEPANSYPHDWSPDGTTILISSHAADRSVFLATISLEDKTLQRLVTLNWEGPRRAQYSPDGRFIAYDSTKGGDRKIYLISADGSQESVLVDSPGERAVSTSLRQPSSAFTVATPRHRRGATTTDRAAVWAGQRPHAASRPGCWSSVLGHPGGSFSTAD